MTLTCNAAAAARKQTKEEKVNLEGDIPEELFKPEEEEEGEDVDYVTSGDLALLHHTIEAKLQRQQEAAEQAASER